MVSGLVELQLRSVRRTPPWLLLLLGVHLDTSGKCFLFFRKGYPVLPEDSQGKVILHNSLPCHLAGNFGDIDIKLGALESVELLADQASSYHLGLRGSGGQWFQDINSRMSCHLTD